MYTQCNKNSSAGNNLTDIASHFAKQFLLDAKQLQNIVAENCNAIYRHVLSVSAARRECIYGTKECQSERRLYITLLAQRYTHVASSAIINVSKSTINDFVRLRERVVSCPDPIHRSCGITATLA